MSEFKVETPQNYEQKCCICIVVDVSGSMQGAPIDELNRGLLEFHKDISSDPVTSNRLEISIVEFCDTVTTLVPPSLVNSFSMPQLNVKGTTKLADGVKKGIEIVQTRKQYYRDSGQPYYRPWIVLISDGAPDPDQDINSLSAEIRQKVAEKAFMFLAVGVQNADMNVLTQISDSSTPPAKLDGLKFSAFFRWLSSSTKSITKSKTGDTINLPDPTNWMTGFKV